MDASLLLAKRSREQEETFEVSSQTTYSSPDTPTTKALRLTRTDPGTTPPLLCSLPPTCHPPHNAPTALADSRELEAHYAKYHAHVCEERGCSAVFPNARLLELHQTECHDPIARIRQERGEKIFACHLESCLRNFLDPRKRRMHLIQAHGFPKEYFFAVTNKGVGGLLKKWGEGASMLRGSWKTRDDQNNAREESEMDVEGNPDSDSDDKSSSDEELLSTRTVKNTSSSTQIYQLANGTVGNNGSAALRKPAHSDAIDTLTDSLDALSFVPSNVRFGRGGRSGQMVRESQPKSRSVSKSRAPHDFAVNATRGPMTNNPTHTQKSEPDVSINIDGALEALKSEMLSSTPVKSVASIDGGGNKYAMFVRGRGRGVRFRGRGRGRGRGQGPHRGQG